ncbi:DUF47 domain-containing protein [Streptomyces tubercidicus]
MKRYLLGTRSTVRRRTRIRDLLVAQIDYAEQGADLAQRACAGATAAQPLRAAMSRIEHKGDAARAALIDRMAASLTTPLEREDLFRVSRSIDDVLDNLRDLVREVAVWEVHPSGTMAEAVEPVKTSLRSLSAAASEGDLQAARHRCLDARKAAGRLRRCYQEGLAEIFDQELTMETLKQREVMRRLDIIGLRLAEAADALLDGLVKRSV